MVVLFVGSDLLDENDAVHIGDHHQETELVAAKVENNAIVWKKVRGCVPCLDVLRLSPLGRLSFSKPRCNERLCLCVLPSELVQPSAPDDAHDRYTITCSLPGSKLNVPWKGTSCHIGQVAFWTTGELPTLT